MLVGTISAVGSLSGSLSMASAPAPEQYRGPYEVTPGESPQTLATASLLMGDNVTIAPIPSNYGRIEQRGSALYIY